MTTIKAEREKRSWSMKKLAQAAGVNAKTISRLENGDPVSADTLRQVRAALGLSLSDQTALRPRLDRYPTSRPSIPRSELILNGSCAVFLAVTIATWPLTWFFGWVLAPDRDPGDYFAVVLAGWVLFVMTGIFGLLILSMGLSYETRIRVRTLDAGEATRNRIWHAIRETSGLQDVAYCGTSSRNDEHRLTFSANVKPEDHSALHRRLRDLGLNVVVESRGATAESHCLPTEDRITS